jgi:hypothetical protein
MAREGWRVGDEWGRWCVGLATLGEVFFFHSSSLDKQGRDFRRPGGKMVCARVNRGPGASEVGRTWGAGEALFPAEETVCLCDLDVIDEVSCVIDGCGEVV